MGTVVAPLERRETGLATDHDLVAAVRCGEDRAFEQLYGRYQRRIAAYVYGMVNDYGRAEDITQEVFISALRRMRETERPIAFKPWIYEIAKNACIDQFRRSRRAEEVSYDAEEGIGAADAGRLAATGPSPDAAVDSKQQLDTLCGAFGGLSETHHQILVLRELEGLSYREIGERMNLSRPSVESTLFRARRRLTEEYDELVSGQRCLRIQGIIGGAADGLLGARDQRRLARHIAHCQPCRREARLAGVDSAALRHRPADGLAAKVAAFLPIPAFLRGRGGGPTTQAQTTVAQWSGPLSTMTEPAVAGWSKAAAAAATLLIAGMGAGAVTTVSSQPAADSAAKPASEQRTAPARERRSRAGATRRSTTQRRAASGGPATGSGGEKPRSGDGSGGGSVSSPGSGATIPPAADSQPQPIQPSLRVPAVGGNGNGGEEKGENSPPGVELNGAPVQVPADPVDAAAGTVGSVDGSAGKAVDETIKLLP